MPGLENSENLPKSSEIFRNLPKSRFLTDGVAQGRSDTFSDVSKYHSFHNCLPKTSYLKMPSRCTGRGHGIADSGLALAGGCHVADPLLAVGARKLDFTLHSRTYVS